MAIESLPVSLSRPASWPEGVSDLAALIHTTDWAQTPLGPVERWPQSLRTSLGICLGSRFPILLWWGPEYIKLYNDAYSAVIGAKHPRALGQRGRECWSEIWHIIGPMLDGVRTRGEATWSDDLMLPLQRLGFTEECYFTFAYSPIREDDGEVVGIFSAVMETTDRVLAARRLATLRELAANALQAHEAALACRDAVTTLASTPADTPFAAMYLLDAERHRLERTATQGLDDITWLPGEVPIDGSAGNALVEILRAACSQEADRSLQVLDLPEAGLSAVAARPWSDPVRSIGVLAVSQPGHEVPHGVLVVGLSPRRPLDAAYRDFLRLAAGQVATAVSSSLAREQERRRAQMLLELDRAKTVFFTNVSHEFRTPLTLILGPLEEVLTSGGVTLPDHTRRDLEATHRNALRLLKLVNTLLDFSRIEAGRVDASLEPTDLAALTAQLASVFRSAVEDAGLNYVVDCPALTELIYVDRAMWEKVVLNLLSNALKFTLRGGIAVRLGERDGHVELTVTDTGCGIDPDELPHVFERFHRARTAQARTHEGSGIGLALSQELVRLHGGEITAANAPAGGAVFTVRIPKGERRPSAERAGTERSQVTTSVASAAYVNEAVGWLTSSAHVPEAVTVAERLRVLVADDNADMREYLRRLCGERWDVETHADGASALAAIRERRPDLVIADVMMPGIDGLALVRALRDDPATSDLPVILLSARAGEEARLEGMQAGADDYLVKPFSARELLGYVEARLAIAETRRDSEATLRQSERRLQDALAQANSSRGQVESLLDAAPLGVYLVDADFRLRQVNPTARPVFGAMQDLVDRDFHEVVRYLWPEPFADEVIRIFEHTLATGEPYVNPELVQTRRDTGRVEYYDCQVHRLPLPDGRFGAVCYFREISRQVLARDALTRAETLTAGQKRALELAVAGCPLADVLQALVQTSYDLQQGQAGTAIYALDQVDELPRMVASAGLPEVYRRALEDPALAAASPRQRAMVQGELACVEDVLADPACEAYLPLAHAHGLRSLWSFPVRTPNGFVRGALSVYRPEPGLPTPSDVEAMRLLADTAGMLLERDRIMRAREAAEQALQQSDRRLRDLADAMPQLVWTSDSAGTVDYYNARASLYYGIGPGQPSGLEWQQLLHADDLAPTLDAWQRATARGRPFSFEHRLRMANGQYRWHLSRAEPVRAAINDTPDRLRWFGTATDVHELRLAREALRANEERLIDADRRKDEFIAMLAHELRNPLAPIRTGLQIIRRGGGSGADLERVGTIMERQLTHVVRLIDDLLDVSRISSGKLVLRKRASALHDLLEAALEANRATIAGAELQLQVIEPPEPLMLDVDPTRFVQVVSNLLHNAAKFTPAGGRIELAATVCPQGDGTRELLLQLTDTGIGIEVHMLGRIFEMFTQVEPGRERSQGGLGIGLALARQLVQMHGGTLRARSAGRGQGSTFELRLPLLEGTQRITHPATPATRTALQRRVLVVDDNADAAEAMAMLIRQLGGIAWAVHDGPTAIARAQECAPEVVLLDLGMPGMDGYETCRRLRELGTSACIVALTGWGHDSDKHRVLRSGFDAHLTKPADPVELEQLLVAGRAPAAVVRP